MKKNFISLSLVVLLVMTSIGFASASSYSPYISGLTINGQPRTLGLPGEILTISGWGLGSPATIAFETKDQVNFGTSVNIIYRTDTSIMFTLPSVPEDTQKIVISSNGVQVSKYFSILTPTSKDPDSALQTYIKDINLDKASDIISPVYSTVVAVIDSGIYLNHPDLQGKIWTNRAEVAGDNIDNDHDGYIDDTHGYNFIDNNAEITQKSDHGTEVAGVIGATKDNNLFIGGVASKVQLMPLIVCDNNGCPTGSVAKAIHYAADNGARVINLSLSGIGTDTYTDQYNDAVQYAYNKGVVIIAAAGNGDVHGGIGYNLDDVPQSPVCNDNGKNMILGVGAIDQDNVHRTNWSNYGKCVDIYAPGTSIFTISPNSPDFTSIVDGTSFAAPIVSGLAAEILSAYPGLTNQLVYSAIINNSYNGVVDAKRLFQYVQSTYKGTLYSNPPSIASSGGGGGSSMASADISGYIFSDVSNTSYNAAEIAYLKKKNIISGNPDGSFKPLSGVNRAELAKLIIIATKSTPTELDKNCFPDVKEDWYAQYVCFAKKEGWLNGYPDGNFRPEQTINQAEASKILLNAMGIKIEPNNLNPYFDVSESDWFEPYATQIYAMNILVKSNQFRPTDMMSRSGITAMLARLVYIREHGLSKYNSESLV